MLKTPNMLNVAREPWVGRAGKRSQEVLISCYCREIALPQGEVRVLLHAQGTYGRLSGAPWVLELRLPHARARLQVAVESPSPTGNYVYCSPTYFQLEHQAWQVGDWQSVSRLLLNELSQRFNTPFQHELASQIADSVSVTAAILSEGPNAAQSPNSFVHSEQSLLFGHSFHPAPKSRVGFSAEDVIRFSPETRSRFQLHYFAVRADKLLQSSLTERSAASLLREDLGADASHVEEGFHPLPVHPWQAEQLLQSPHVAQAMAKGELRYLGPLGVPFFPTSSLRTLYAAELPYFYKCSLHVRITNCLRKNAVYELEGALFATRALRSLASELQASFPGLRFLEEPAFATVRLGESPETQRDLEERFAVILRETLPPSLAQEGKHTQVAGALFGTDPLTRARLMALVAESAKGLPFEDAADLWFQHYVGQLLPPVLYAFFHHGLVHESHLQNTLLVTQEGTPVGLVLRDLEGMKLVRERFQRLSLEGLSDEAVRALSYDDEQGWKRIAYCLFVNNLSEAVAALAMGSASLERKLWGRARQTLVDFERRFGSAHSSRRLMPLLAGAPFPGKANLTTRFFKQADRQASYVPVPNPLCAAPEPRAWN